MSQWHICPECPFHKGHLFTPCTTMLSLDLLLEPLARAACANGVRPVSLCVSSAALLGTGLRKNQDLLLGRREPWRRPRQRR